MELKSYQKDALAVLEGWFNELKEKEIQVGRTSLGKKLEADVSDQIKKKFPTLAWESYHKKTYGETFQVPEYISRTAASGDPVPHVCLKVPTGGGKTLMGVAALKHIVPDVGLVLWVVPTKAIYDQTLASFQLREHPYRAMLDHISRGKALVLQKDDNFTTSEVNTQLCVMLLMFPAVNRSKDREYLKIFRHRGDMYASFFEDLDAKQHPDLDLEVDGDSVKHSLVNVLKILRPTVVLDEAHKAYGSNKQKTQEFVRAINWLNPELVLELSATPRQDVSNILVNISGDALWKEEMVKFPVMINNLAKDWKETLEKTKEKLDVLEKNAKAIRDSEARYVRPIALVRVERTGRDQKEDQHYVHSAHVKDYLIKKLKVHESSIRIQSSEQKELIGDDLLSDLSSVSWIITKDALKEGWDCSFAYILALLDNTTAMTTVTQMVGRVLRQPEARRIGSPDGPLNRCYIYCYKPAQNDAVEAVKRGLCKEGLDGLGPEAVLTTDDLDVKTTTVERRDCYKKLKIFLPRVLHRQGSKWRLIDYEHDILAGLDWSKIDAGEATSLPPRQKAPNETEAAVQPGRKTKHYPIAGAETGEAVTLGYFVTRLDDMVRNPWQAARIVEDFLKRHRERFEDSEISNNRDFLLKTLKVRINEAMDREAERLFRDKVDRNEIQFHLKTSGEELNFEIEKSFEVRVAKTDTRLQGEFGGEIGRSLFWPVYEREFNGLEKNFALYLDGTDAIHWWHRVAARKGYGLQGWRLKGATIYPDFVACTRRGGLLVLETKGNWLEGTKDTEYKKKLLQFLEEAYKSALDRGEMTIDNNIRTTAVFRLLFKETWENEMNKLLQDLRTTSGGT